MASRADWAPCLTGDSPCWAFIAERPFVTVAPAATAAAAAARRRLFPCATAAQHGFGGDSFELLTVLGDGPSAAAPHWCVYAGDAAECTFDELLAYVDASATNGTHPAFGAALGFLGALLSTPERAGMGFWLETIYRWLLNWLHNFIGHIPAVPAAPAGKQPQVAAVAEQFAPAQHALHALPRLVVAFVLLFFGAALVIGPQSLRLSKDLT
eukprot:contig_27956_g6882